MTQNDLILRFSHCNFTRKITQKIDLVNVYLHIFLGPKTPRKKCVKNHNNVGSRITKQSFRCKKDLDFTLNEKMGKKLRSCMF